MRKLILVPAVVLLKTLQVKEHFELILVRWFPRSLLTKSFSLLLKVFFPGPLMTPRSKYSGCDTHFVFLEFLVSGLPNRF